MSAKNKIDFSDIQGIVRYGHGHLEQSCFWLLQVVDPASASRWLLDAPITSAEPANPLPGKAMQIAFSAPGLSALGLSEAVLDEFSDEFISGMATDENRSRRLGDIGQNAPSGWAWGGTESSTPHVLLMLYTTGSALDAWSQEIQTVDFRRGFDIQARLKTAVHGPREPFGFVDGISQPSIEWHDDARADREKSDRYSNQLALGEALLGYSNEYGQYTSRPLLDPKADLNAHHLVAARDDSERRDLGCNGTYLVLRQLEQDVAAFWRYVDEAADSNPTERERLAALMVGRERDGVPLVEKGSRPIAGIDTSSESGESNHFTFERDPLGRQCPLGSHVRRSNPRSADYPAGVRGIISRLVREFGFGRQHPTDDLVAASRFHRILRRGRVYGDYLSPEEVLARDPVAGERGLQFVALGANISRQFEFVQNAWLASSKFAGLTGQSDPLLGNRETLRGGEATDSFTAPQSRGPALCLKSLPQFVTVRGGAYFFLPSVSAVKYIASQSQSAE